MRKLTHLQALRLLDADRQNLLAEEQANLTAHLETCAECRAYANDTAALGPELTQLFHEHWDARRPQANVVAAVRPAAQRRAWKRLGFELTWGVLGILAVFALMGMFRFFLPRTATQPTATQSANVTSTLTQQATTTKTGRPTRTPTSRPTRGPTHTITPTPDYPATESAQKTAWYITATASVATVIAAGPPTIEAYRSPDGHWEASFSRFDCVPVVGSPEFLQAYDQFDLIDQKDGSARRIDAQLQYCGGMGAYGLGGLFWSPNSRYFYYTTAREGWPDGGCVYWERDTAYVDVTTGASGVIGYGPLSVDHTKLAAWQWGGEERQLIIWDINQGEIGRISVGEPSWSRDEIAWSPDGQALVYLQVKEICSPNSLSRLVRVDFPALTQTLLPDLENVGFVGVRWEKPGELLLTDATGQPWKYDFATQGYEKRNPDGNITPSPAEFTSTVRTTLPNEQITEVIPSIWNYYNLAEQLQLKQPGSLEFMVDVTNDWNLIWPFYWCAADSDVLVENLPALTVTFRVDGVEISKENLLEYERTSNDWACHYWTTMVSGWPRGQKVDLEITYRLNRELNDGYAIYPAGDYRYRVTANVIIP